MERFLTHVCLNECTLFRLHVNCEVEIPNCRINTHVNVASVNGKTKQELFTIIPNNLT